MGSEARRARRACGGAAILGIAMLAMLALQPEPAGAVKPFTLGFGDPLYLSKDSTERGSVFEMTTDLRAGMVLLPVGWSSVAPAEPSASFDPRNPSSKEYRFGAVDDAVRDASARGLKVVFNVTTAPSWAEGPSPPPDARPGTWRPDPAAFGDFAVALASRYSGSYPDPLKAGQALPRVRYYQAWNEPNLHSYLTPQWSNGQPESPLIYRALLNSFYEGVKSVDSRDIVLTAGIGPYGETGFGERMHPVQFLRYLFCLQGRRRLRVVCTDRTRFDVLAHHPINAYRPTRPADHPDDATTPDVARIRRVLRRAVKVGTAQPRGAKPIWATELWWDTVPPAARGVRLAKQARWMEQALYVLWRQGVRRIILLRVKDREPNNLRDIGNGAGLVFADGRHKPSYRAVRFPFVGDRLNKRQVRVWGRPPRRGRVRIQRRSSRGWRTIARARARRRAPFSRRILLKGHARLRAVAGEEKSLVWRQR